MILVLNKWIGRFGNNLQSIRNCLHLCFSMNIRQLRIPNHRLLKSKVIDVFPNLQPVEDEKIIEIQRMVSFQNHLLRKKFKKIKFLPKNDIKIREIIRNLVKFNFDTKSQLTEKDLVIHIRSGDIFSTNVHPKFIVPPNDYYKKIIDSVNPDKIYVVAEDKLNPSINFILKEYQKNAIFHSKNLTEDINLILQAKILVTSFGSFSTYLSYLSKNLKKVYSPHYHPIRYPYHNSIIVNCGKYEKLIGKWKKSEKQIILLKTFKIPDQKIN